MDRLLDLIRQYRVLMLQLGDELAQVKAEELYEGYADTFIDTVKSPEVGLTPYEAEQLMKMYHLFCLLEPEDLPSVQNMKLMVNKKVDMELLESAQTLSNTDFKELIKDKEIGTQERTWEYEIIKRAKESGSIKKVFDEELKEAYEELRKRLK